MTSIDDADGRVPARAADLAADALVVTDHPSAPPAITVLMPLFRQERFVAEAVESVLAQRGVVCDVIISDDDAEGRALQRALDTLQAAHGTHPHGVRVRRGAMRRRRWHVIDLIDHALTDIVVQAHGDDRSLPDRAARVHGIMTQTGAAFLATATTTIDESGGALDRGEPPPTGELRTVPFAEALTRPAWAIGAAEAWRVSALQRFAPLDPPTAPLSHDRIVLMRAALLGAAYYLDEALVERREHTENWHNRLVVGDTWQTRKHGWALVRTMLYDRILRDIDDARRLRLCSARTAKQARMLADEHLREALAMMRSLHGGLVASGWNLMWRPEAESESD